MVLRKKGGRWQRACCCCGPHMRLTRTWQHLGHVCCCSSSSASSSNSTATSDTTSTSNSDHSSNWMPRSKPGLDALGLLCLQTLSPSSCMPCQAPCASQRTLRHPHRHLYYQGQQQLQGTVVHGAAACAPHLPAKEGLQAAKQGQQTAKQQMVTAGKQVYKQGQQTSTTGRQGWLLLPGLVKVPWQQQRCSSSSCLRRPWMC
mmetsp:Transcript_7142/g.17236  ORF Transcript_7142/g.17236 Transcript_7142/m.17236 type:complete len:202 (-) Transcript_7142:305-910(-)